MAVQAPRQVDAEKREPGVGHRVDEAVDEVRRVPHQVQVLTPEGHDAGARVAARSTCQAVALQSGAGDEEATGHRTVFGRQLPAVGRGGTPGDTDPGPDGTACLDDEVGESMCNGSKIGPSGRRDVEGGRAAEVGLEFTGTLRGQFLDRHTVRPGPVGQVA